MLSSLGRVPTAIEITKRTKRSCERTRILTAEDSPAGLRHLKPRLTAGLARNFIHRSSEVGVKGVG